MGWKHMRLVDGKMVESRVQLDDWLYLTVKDIDWMSRDRLYWRNLFLRAAREVLPHVEIFDAVCSGDRVRRVWIVTSAARLLARRRRMMRDKLGFRP